LAPAPALAKGTFDSSAIFPGTSRRYWLSVPDGLDPTVPAPSMVFQDGILYDAPHVLRGLIGEGAIPPLVGIFVTPGERAPTLEGALPRANRSFEYDGLGDRFVRHLDDELYPHVEATHGIALSRAGVDRGITGVSSGGAAAFTAAWERPTSFSRVFTGIGSFTGLRGADGYATLVRKVEPKPVRVFVQDGSGDLDIFAGDWWMANQTLVRALTFAGWDVRHVFDDGGHDSHGAAAAFADAMRWLWRDHPQPVVADTSRSRSPVVGFVRPDQPWEPADGPPPVEPGRRAVQSPDRSLRFEADPVRPRVHSYVVGADGEDEHGEAYFHLHVVDGLEDRAAHALTVDDRGHLYAATTLGIQICEQMGRVYAVVDNPPGGTPDALTFGDPDRTNLYACVGRTWWRRPTQATGVLPTDPPTTPPMGFY
jgi:enterochelin esterase-like enzyme